MAGREFVGIAGPTCSGKTSLAGELLRRMPESAVGLSMDEYDRYPAGSTMMKMEMEVPTIQNWEDPELFDLSQLALDLLKLRHGQSVKLETRSRESMAAGETERVVNPARTTIVEGVFAFFNPTARAIMDLTVYVDIPLDIMVQRRLETLRPGSDGWPWDEPDYIRGAMVAGTEAYVLQQRELAQLRLDGTQPTADLADTVMRHLN